MKCYTMSRQCPLVLVVKDEEEGAIKHWEVKEVT
jgi:hypothetical protein